MHTEKILRSAEDLPVVVEVVDTEERICGAVPEFERMAPGCLITLVRVEMRGPGGGVPRS